MKTSKAVSKIIQIPYDLRIRRNMSMYTLLNEIGYFQTYNKISIRFIRKILARVPKCVNEWIIYSENRRCEKGWYFIQEGNVQYKVGYFFYGKKIKEITYDNSLDACAEFIYREIEDIRKARNPGMSMLICDTIWDIRYIFSDIRKMLYRLWRYMRS